jgi:hypothetical protein
MVDRNVRAPWSKDVDGITQFGSHTLDDRMGSAWLCFRALRHVEGAAKKIAKTFRTANRVPSVWMNWLFSSATLFSLAPCFIDRKFGGQCFATSMAKRNRENKVDLFGEDVCKPEAQNQLRTAFKRGFQTREAEINLARLLGDLADH